MQLQTPPLLQKYQHLYRLNRVDISDNLMARSLLHFVPLAWKVLEPSTDFTSNWHIEAVCEHLQAVSDGHIRSLLINIPPRHMKSLAVCVFWPVWEWIKHPSTRWLFSSYAMTLATRDSVKCRRLIDSDWFQSHWADRFTLTTDQNTKTRFDNDRSGCRISTSVCGAATGEGGDRVVVDDPHNVTYRESQRHRTRTLEWWDQTMTTRLNDPAKGAKVIVMQRLHEKDLSGHVLAQGGYTHLCLPAEFEPTRKCITMLNGNPFFVEKREKEGELLWRDRVGEHEIANFKLQLGPAGYAGQFQQRPAPASGNRFDRQWFRTYRIAGDFYELETTTGTKRIARSECDRFAVMDPAGTEPQQNSRPCYTVIQVWDMHQTGPMMLVHQYRKQVATPEAAETAARILRDFEANFLAIEKDGLGLGIVQTLKKQGLTIKPIKARGSKEARSETAEIRMAAGYIFFPQGESFVFDLEQELIHFPRGEYADQVDALSHAAIHVQKMVGPPRVPDAPKDGSHSDSSNRDETQITTADGSTPATTSPSVPSTGTPGEG